ncbi:uncharacterized protein BDZ99DRAFT_574608 [Mytilinidion resinicola]|uniref:Mid2 domain-containing protein n=1 Tax=Mytilinidion resinicola TaxID=574789 RepID=A0A6A6YD18_9PEZI|nr:uncharacterized protein BDZ99DRAFT_574608 [Mytilinidion resinicola]KAF2805737.1 hypothetical protein BDZ99DRAFT_574608 [Mytilinidion resinicola]
MFGMIRPLLILGHLLLAIGISAESNFWLFPGQNGANNDYSENPILPQSTPQPLRWSTDFDAYTIRLWQQHLSGNKATAGETMYAKSSEDSEVGNFTWTVQTYSMDLEDSNVFFLQVDDLHGHSITSHYFNITAGGVSSSITTLATSTTTSTSVADSSTRSATATQSFPASTPSAATQSPQPQNKDTAVKIGLGVGLGLGIPLVLLLGVYLGMQAMKTRQTAGETMDQSIYIGPDPPKYPLVEYSQAPSSEELRTEPSELPGDRYNAPQELS